MRVLILALAAFSLACAGSSPTAPAFAEGDVPAVHSGDLVLNVLGVTSKALVLSYGTYVHDANEQPVAGVRVTYRINGRYSARCTSAANGGCGVASAIQLHGRAVPSEASVEVVSMVKDGVGYDASANHDASGDSDGTIIVKAVP